MRIGGRNAALVRFKMFNLMDCIQRGARLVQRWSFDLCGARDVVCVAESEVGITRTLRSRLVLPELASAPYAMNKI